MLLTEFGLTPKQYRFCNRYLTNDYNGSEAARYAGYSAYTAKEIASENLTKPNVQAYLEVAMKEAALNLGLTPEYLLRKLKKGVDHSFDGDELKIRDGIVCISEINKMLGNYEATKVDNTHHVEELGKLIDMEKEKQL